MIHSLNRARHAPHLQAIDDCQSALGSQCAVVKAESRECVVQLHTHTLNQSIFASCCTAATCDPRTFKDLASAQAPALRIVFLPMSRLVRVQFTCAHTYTHTHSRLASMRRARHSHLQAFGKSQSALGVDLVVADVESGESAIRLHTAHHCTIHSSTERTLRLSATTRAPAS